MSICTDERLSTNRVKCMMQVNFDSQRVQTYSRWPTRELYEIINAKSDDVITISAGAGTGKTYWALQCACHLAKRRSVGFFTLDTSASALCKMISGQLDYGPDLDVISASGWTVADILATTVMREYQIIFIDYLQLLQGPGKTRHAVGAALATALCALARTCGITVVALSQLPADTSSEERGA